MGKLTFSLYIDLQSLIQKTVSILNVKELICLRKLVTFISLSQFCSEHFHVYWAKIVQFSSEITFEIWREHQSDTCSQSSNCLKQLWSNWGYIYIYVYIWGYIWSTREYTNQRNYCGSFTRVGGPWFSCVLQLSQKHKNCLLKFFGLVWFLIFNLCSWRRKKAISSEHLGVSCDYLSGVETVANFFNTILDPVL